MEKIEDLNSAWNESRVSMNSSSSHYCVVKKEFFGNTETFFHPKYDFDFSYVPFTSCTCVRGGEAYHRPSGWYRMALKVWDKYPDGNTWLGTGGWRDYSVSGEWPVSYHGTSIQGAQGIVTSHYRAGGREVFGRGIYSTPSLVVAEQYATPFVSGTTGNTYKVIVENRINPEEREVYKKGEYWLIPVPRGTSAQQERQIVENSIRPYGILIKVLAGS